MISKITVSLRPLKIRCRFQEIKLYSWYFETESLILEALKIGKKRAKWCDKKLSVLIGFDISLYAR